MGLLGLGRCLIGLEAFATPFVFCNDLKNRFSDLIKLALMGHLHAKRILYIKYVDGPFAVGGNQGARYLQTKLRQRSRYFVEQPGTIPGINLDKRMCLAR